MAEYWFKPKTYGYGATPSSWKGWAATALFAVALVAYVAWFLQSQGAPETMADYAIWFGGIAAITFALHLALPGQDRWRVALAMGKERQCLKSRTCT